MAILNSCCCWRSVRKACYACAIYTFVYYICFAMSLWQYTLAIINKTSLGEDNKHPSLLLPDPKELGLVMRFIIYVLTAACTTGPFVCFLLIIGIWADQKLLLIPWIIDTFIIIVLETCFVGYLGYLKRASPNPAVAMIITVDFFALVLNNYALLCVISQLQEYCAGRGFAHCEENRNRGSVRNFSKGMSEAQCESGRRTNIYEAKTQLNGFSPSKSRKSFRSASRGPSIKISKPDVVQSNETNTRSLDQETSSLGSSKEQEIDLQDKIRIVNEININLDMESNMVKPASRQGSKKKVQFPRESQSKGSDTDVTTEGDSTSGREFSLGKGQENLPLIPSQSFLKNAEEL